MTNKDWARFLTDEEIKLCYAEYRRRQRGGKQEIKPESLEETKPVMVSKEQISKDLDIFSP